MKRRRSVVVVSILVGFAGVWACSFPDVEFESSSADAEAGVPDAPAPPSDASDEEQIDATITLPPDVDPNGEDAGTITFDDASLTPVDAGCGGCDCDGDGYDRLDLDAGCDGGGVNPGIDCDDTIKAIHPRPPGDYIADTWPNAAVHPIVGDWDCDGEVIKQYNYNVTCGLLGLLCQGGKGFRGDPQCGGSGEYVECKGLPPLLCSPVPVDTRKQGCR